MTSHDASTRRKEARASRKITQYTRRPQYTHANANTRGSLFPPDNLRASGSRQGTSAGQDEMTVDIVAQEALHDIVENNMSSDNESEVEDALLCEESAQAADEDVSQLGDSDAQADSPQRRIRPLLDVHCGPFDLPGAVDGPDSYHVMDGHVYLSRRYDVPVPTWVPMNFDEASTKDIIYVEVDEDPERPMTPLTLDDIILGYDDEAPTYPDPESPSGYDEEAMADNWQFRSPDYMGIARYGGTEHGSRYCMNGRVEATSNVASGITRYGRVVDEHEFGPDETEMRLSVATHMAKTMLDSLLLDVHSLSGISSPHPDLTKEFVLVGATAYSRRPQEENWTESLYMTTILENQFAVLNIPAYAG